jgi:predicted nucleic acid-binding protein
MVYLDTSVLLAHVLVEERQPPAAMWKETLVASRLVEYESWVRVHALGLGSSHGESIERALREVAFVELTNEALARAREPFPTPIRTLDALHLASAAYLREVGAPVSFATYDERLARAAKSLDFELYPLP